MNIEEVLGDRNVPHVLCRDASSPTYPSDWRRVVAAENAQDRVVAALELWSQRTLASLPLFSSVLRDRLRDVRVVKFDEDAFSTLTYLIQSHDGFEPVWVGDPPGSDEDGARSVLMGGLPEGCHQFMRQTHGGFAALADRVSYGITPPYLMQTMAEWLEQPEGVPEWSDMWWECPVVDSRRLLRVAGREDDFSICVSPDIPKGEVVVINADGLCRRDMFWSSVDGLLVDYVEGR